VLLHQIRQTIKDLASFPATHLTPRPALKRFPRSFHGQVHVFFVGGGDFCDHFFGAGIEGLEGLARDGVDELEGGEGGGDGGDDERAR